MMCWYKNTRHTFCRKSQNATARMCSLSSRPCCDPHLPRTESCKQATRAHACHKNVIGLFNAGWGALWEWEGSNIVLYTADFCSWEHRFLLPRRAVCWQATRYCGTPRGSSNGRCFHGWIMHSSVYFVRICERNPLHCVLSKHFSLFVHFFFI